ncbi:hypothetical protein XBI1_770021 [Xenorhabdus bovienii str. Intermedium]|uniref:Uncharacterized protein n=1 Tax=Xenorhabdus bovienii str. Intermedium TaxID=1379677 RepID=A0A077QG82_XENBV|nr:hypothetical protein XBI1_770021 [Xenorhabdus bovienii str. Intermedium]
MKRKRDIALNLHHAGDTIYQWVKGEKSHLANLLIFRTHLSGQEFRFSDGNKGYQWVKLKGRIVPFKL